MTVVEVDRISRRYEVRTGSLRRRRKQTDAVREVTFHIGPGEMLGVLGPNGAGKTTIIKMLTTLLLPTSGTARVLGYDVATEPRAVRSRIGYVFGGDRGLYERLSADDNLRYFAELYGIPWDRQRRRIDELLELVDLRDRRRDRVEGFSRGMRQRLHIARGLLHDPPVLFLDEPSIGLDPVAARNLRGVVRGLADAGKTVLLTTHYMYEADELCDRIAILRDGAIVAEGTPATLKAGVSDGTVVDVVVYGASEVRIDRVRGLAGVRSVGVHDVDQAQVLRVRAEPGAEVIPPLLDCLNGLSIGNVTAREPSLEDAYVELVGRS